MERPPRKLLDQVRAVIRRKHYSILTEANYSTGFGDTFIFMARGTPRNWDQLKSSNS